MGPGVEFSSDVKNGAPWHRWRESGGLEMKPAAPSPVAAGVAVVQRRRNSCSRRSVEICTMVGRPWGQRCGSGVSANGLMMGCI